jgi:hypothetical protein
VEIHSSSIRTYPSGVNRPKVDSLSVVQNNPAQGDVNSSTKTKYESSEPAPSTQTPDEIEQALGQENMRILPVVVDGAADKPFSLRIQQALNAYSTQLNQPIYSQRSELISGIDFYV